MKLADRIAQLRKQFGFSQEELGEKLGVSRQAVSKWESGQAVPELEKLREISRIFHISLDELLQEQDYTVPQPETQAKDLSNLSSEPAAPDPLPSKAGRRWRTLWIAGIGIAAILCLTAIIGGFWMQHRTIAQLNQQIDRLQSDLSQIQAENSSDVSSSSDHSQNSPTDPDSILADFRYDVLSLQPITKTAKVQFTVLPKSYTAQTTAFLTFTGSDFETIHQEILQNDAGVFETTVSLPLSHEIHGTITFEQDGEKTVQALDPICGLDQHLLTIQTSFEGDMTRYGLSDSGSTLALNGSLKVEALIDDATYPALANYPESGTVQLFKDGKKYREYSADFSETQPESAFEEGESPVMQGYSLRQIAAAVPIQERFAPGEWQTLQIVVTVVDRFGISYQESAYSFDVADENIERSSETQITYPTK